MTAFVFSSSSGGCSFACPSLAGLWLRRRRNASKPDPAAMPAMAAPPATLFLLVRFLNLRAIASSYVLMAMISHGVALGYGGGSGGGTALGRDGVRTALLATPETRVPMAIPSTTLITAVASLDAVDASAANGMMVAMTVISPIVQPKNRMGRGVLTRSR